MRSGSAPAAISSSAAWRLIGALMACSQQPMSKADFLGEQVGAAGRQVAQFGDGGRVFCGGEVAPLGVAGGGAGELGAQQAVAVGRRPP
jgi:hypothetical protein